MRVTVQMRVDGTQESEWRRKRMNHLPIWVSFFIVCAVFFKAKFMNASCVIVQCVHKNAQLVLSLSLSPSLSVFSKNTWIQSLHLRRRVCCICVSREDFSFWNQQSSSLASKRKISVLLFFSSIFNNAIVDRPNTERRASDMLWQKCFFFFISFFPFCYFTWKHSAEKKNISRLSFLPDIERWRRNNLESVQKSFFCAK